MNVANIHHRGESRLALYFDYDSSTIEKVKQIEGRKWSKSNHCWHIPDTIESTVYLKKFFALDPPVELLCTQAVTAKLPNANIPNVDAAPVTIEHKATINPKDLGLTIRWKKSHFSISFLYDSTLVAFIKQLEQPYWCSKLKEWHVQSSIANAEALQLEFEYWTYNTINTLKTQ